MSEEEMKPQGKTNYLIRHLHPIDVDGMMQTPKLNAEMLGFGGNTVPFLSISEKYPASSQVSKEQVLGKGTGRAKTFFPVCVNFFLIPWRSSQESLGAQTVIQSAPRQTPKTCFRDCITGTQPNRASLNPILVMTNTLCYLYIMSAGV